MLWKGKARVTIPYLTSTCTIVAVLLRGWCTNHGGGRAGGVAGEEARPGGVTACKASPRPLQLERRRANNWRQQVELGAQVCSLAVTLRRRRARMSRSRSATTQTSGLELELSEHGHRRLHGAHKGPGGGRQQQSRVGGGMSNHLRWKWCQAAPSAVGVGMSSAGHCAAAAEGCAAILRVTEPTSRTTQLFSDVTRPQTPADQRQKAPPD